MTAIQLNAELHHAMGKIANDTALLEKVLDFVKSLIVTKDQAEAERQQAYVKDSLYRAFSEVEQARDEGRKLQTADEFIAELELEATA